MQPPTLDQHRQSRGVHGDDQYVTENDITSDSNDEFASASEGDDDAAWDPVVIRSPVISRQSPQGPQSPQPEISTKADPHIHQQPTESSLLLSPQQHQSFGIELENFEPESEEQHQLEQHQLEQHQLELQYAEQSSWETQFRGQQNQTHQHQMQTFQYSSTQQIDEHSFTSSGYGESTSGAIYTTVQQTQQAAFDEFQPHQPHIGSPLPQQSSQISSGEAMARGNTTKLRERMRPSSRHFSKVVQAYLDPNASAIHRTPLSESARQAWLREHEDQQQHSSEDEVEENVDAIHQQRIETFMEQFQTTAPTSVSHSNNEVVDRLSESASQSYDTRSITDTRFSSTTQMTATRPTSLHHSASYSTRQSFTGQSAATIDGEASDMADMADMETGWEFDDSGLEELSTTNQLTNITRATEQVSGGTFNTLPNTYQSPTRHFSYEKQTQQTSVSMPTTSTQTTTFSAVSIQTMEPFLAYNAEDSWGFDDDIGISEPMEVDLPETTQQSLVETITHTLAKPSSTLIHQVHGDEEETWDYDDEKLEFDTPMATEQSTQSISTNVSVAIQQGQGNLPLVHDVHEVPGGADDAWGYDEELDIQLEEPVVPSQKEHELVTREPIPPASAKAPSSTRSVSFVAQDNEDTEDSWGFGTDEVVQPELETEQPQVYEHLENLIQIEPICEYAQAETADLTSMSFGETTITREITTVQESKQTFESSMQGVIQETWAASYIHSSPALERVVKQDQSRTEITIDNMVAGDFATHAEDAWGLDDEAVPQIDHDLNFASDLSGLDEAAQSSCMEINYSSQDVKDANSSKETEQIVILEELSHVCTDSDHEQDVEVQEVMRTASESIVHTSHVSNTLAIVAEDSYVEETTGSQDVAGPLSPSIPQSATEQASRSQDIQPSPLVLTLHQSRTDISTTQDDSVVLETSQDSESGSDIYGDLSTARSFNASCNRLNEILDDDDYLEHMERGVPMGRSISTPISDEESSPKYIVEDDIAELMEQGMTYPFDDSTSPLEDDQVGSLDTPFSLDEDISKVRATPTQVQENHAVSSLELTIPTDELVSQAPEQLDTSAQTVLASEEVTSVKVEEEAIMEYESTHEADTHSVVGPHGQSSSVQITNSTQTKDYAANKLVVMEDTVIASIDTTTHRESVEGAIMDAIIETTSDPTVETHVEVAAEVSAEDGVEAIAEADVETWTEGGVETRTEGGVETRTEVVVETNAEVRVDSRTEVTTESRTEVSTETTTMVIAEGSVEVGANYATITGATSEPVNRSDSEAQLAIETIASELDANLDPMNPFSDAAAYEDQDNWPAYDAPNLGKAAPIESEHEPSNSSERAQSFEVQHHMYEFTESKEAHPTFAGLAEPGVDEDAWMVQDMNITIEAEHQDILSAATEPGLKLPSSKSPTEHETAVEYTPFDHAAAEEPTSTPIEQSSQPEPISQPSLVEKSEGIVDETWGWDTSEAEIEIKDEYEIQETLSQSHQYDISFSQQQADHHTKQVYIGGDEKHHSSVLNKTVEAEPEPSLSVFEAPPDQEETTISTSETLEATTIVATTFITSQAVKSDVYGSLQTQALSFDAVVTPTDTCLSVGDKIDQVVEVEDGMAAWDNGESWPEVSQQESTSVLRTSDEHNLQDMKQEYLEETAASREANSLLDELDSILNDGQTTVHYQSVEVDDMPKSLRPGSTSDTVAHVDDHVDDQVDTLVPEADPWGEEIPEMEIDLSTVHDNVPNPTTVESSASLTHAILEQPTSTPEIASDIKITKSPPEPSSEADRAIQLEVTEDDADAWGQDMDIILKSVVHASHEQVLVQTEETIKATTFAVESETVTSLVTLEDDIAPAGSTKSPIEGVDHGPALTTIVTPIQPLDNIVFEDDAWDTEEPDLQADFQNSLHGELEAFKDEPMLINVIDGVSPSTTTKESSFAQEELAPIKEDIDLGALDDAWGFDEENETSITVETTFKSSAEVSSSYSIMSAENFFSPGSRLKSAQVPSVPHLTGLKDHAHAETRRESIHGDSAMKTDSSEGEGSSSNLSPWQDISPASVSKRSEALLSIGSGMESVCSVRSLDDDFKACSSSVESRPSHSEGSGSRPGSMESKKGLEASANMSWTTDLKEDDEWDNDLDAHSTLPSLQSVEEHSETAALKVDLAPMTAETELNVHSSMVEFNKVTVEEKTQAEEPELNLPELGGADSWDFDQDILDSDQALATGSCAFTAASMDSFGLSKDGADSYIESPPLQAEPRVLLTTSSEEKVTSDALGPKSETPVEGFEDDSHLPLAIRQQRARMRAKGKPLPPISKYKSTKEKKLSSLSSPSATASSPSLDRSSVLEMRSESMSSPLLSPAKAPVSPLLQSKPATVDQKFLSPALQKQRERLEQKRAAAAAAVTTAVTPKSGARRLTVTASTTDPAAKPPSGPLSMPLSSSSSSSTTPGLWQALGSPTKELLLGGLSSRLKDPSSEPLSPSTLSGEDDRIHGLGRRGSGA
ncbi:hypothetical protein BGW38_002757, partial [Lunasporangiospora selenospora]